MFDTYPLSQARWKSQVKSVKTIIFWAPQIKASLEHLIVTCDDLKAFTNTKVYLLILWILSTCSASLLGKIYINY